MNTEQKYLFQNKVRVLVKTFKRVSLLIIVSVSSYYSQVANYVNNSSFEIVLNNVSVNPVDAAIFWEAIDSSSAGYYLFGMPPVGPAPYCSTGFQYPKTKSNFILSQCFANDPAESRLYPRNRLKQNLKPNTTYCAKYYMVNTNNNRVAIENYGMHFGDATLDTITKCMVPLTYLIPQIEYSGPIITDTLRWTAISGTFVANGTEKYMVLGNFRSNAATNTVILNTPTLQTMSNDIYIDDVSLVEMDLPAFAGRDTLVFPGKPVFLGRQPDVGIDEACIWYKLPDLINPIDTIAGLWVYPSSTSTYIVKQQLWCSTDVKWDTVVVETDIYVGNVTSSAVEKDIRIFPNPADNYLEIKINSEEIKSSLQYFAIYDHLGQLIKEEVLRQAQQPDGEFKIKTNDLEPGVYFLKLTLRQDQGKSGNYQTVSKRFVIAR